MVLKSILNSNFYHGRGKKRKFYEIWEYKIVDSKGENMFIISPGIVRENNVNEGFSFIKVVNCLEKQQKQIPFGVDIFKADKKTFNIEIDKNSFGEDHLKVNYNKGDTQILGELMFVNVVPWSKAMRNNTMGLFRLLPKLDYYTHLVALEGEIIGKLLINQKEIDFVGGTVVIEKRWGKKTPEAFLRIQMNAFDLPNTAFYFNYGKVFSKLNLFHGAFQLGEQVYKFTKGNQSKLELNLLTPTKMNFSLLKDDIKLHVKAIVNEKDYLIYDAVSKDSILNHEQESFVSEAEVELIDLYRNKTLYIGKGKSSGIKIIGDLDKL